MFKTLEYLFNLRDMLNFDFLEKGLLIVYPSHFVNEFSRKLFLMLYLSTDKISLPDCRRVTREGEGGRRVSAAFFRKLEKSALIWRKHALVVVIYG